MNYTFLKSRTFWTVVAMFVIGGTNAISTYIPTNIEPIVMLILGGLATYFHINPARSYK